MRPFTASTWLSIAVAELDMLGIHFLFAISHKEVGQIFQGVAKSADGGIAPTQALPQGMLWNWIKKSVKVNTETKVLGKCFDILVGFGS